MCCQRLPTANESSLCDGVHGADLHWHIDKGKGYAFQIVYPPQPAQSHALYESIHNFGAGNKCKILAATTEWNPAQSQSTLDAGFDIARYSAGFVLVLTRG
jgi:hypothetical protein